MSETCHKRIGRYELLAELGHGAMGIVYKACDPHLDRTVAIKTLRLDLGLAPEHQEDLRRRFHREAMAAGRLNHPNIVAIHDVLGVEGTPYIVMEYVEGQTLAQLLAAGGPLPPPQAVELVLQACRALEYAHARGVVHRDVKPANILVARGGEVKVSDFGIARIAGTKMTQTGTMLGSPSYMSPEQVRGVEVDGRSDLFSLGVVLYEALAGADPFTGESPSTVLYKIVHEEPAALPERNGAVPAALDAVVQRALAKDPERRFPTAGAFADALSRALEHVTGVAATQQQGCRQTVMRAPSAGRRYRRPIWAGAGFLAAVLVGVALLWGRPSETGKPAPQAPAPPPTAAAASPTRAEGPPPAEPPKRQATPRRVERAKVPAGRAASKGTAVAAVPQPAGPPVRMGSGRGSIRIITNTGVEVIVDGQFVGRVGRSPFVVTGVGLGRRTIGLRLGPVEQRFQGTLQEDQPFSLTYYFPGGGPPAAREGAWPVPLPAAPARPPVASPPPRERGEAPLPNLPRSDPY